MIKNWTVKTKQIRNSGKKYKYIKSFNNKTKRSEYVKDLSKEPKTIKDGFKRHVNYLLSNKNEQHQNTIINVLCNNAGHILDEMENRKLQRQSDGLRGGGVVNFASSFVLSLPADVAHASSNEWRKIAKIVVTDIAKTNNLQYQDVLKNILAVHHDERNHGKHKNSHIHLLVGNVINGNYEKGITQNKTTNAVKRSFNKAVKKVLGVSHKSYIPKNENVDDTPLWLARLNKNNDLSVSNTELTNKNDELQNSVTALTGAKVDLKKEVTALTIKKGTELSALDQLTEQVQAEKKVLKQFALSRQAIKSWFESLKGKALQAIKRKAIKAAETIDKVEDRVIRNIVYDTVVELERVKGLDQHPEVKVSNKIKRPSL